jgi:hypothetical protein
LDSDPEAASESGVGTGITTGDGYPLTPKDSTVGEAAISGVGTGITTGDGDGLTAVESTVGDAAISGVGTGIPIGLLEFVAADAGVSGFPSAAGRRVADADGVAAVVTGLMDSSDLNSARLSFKRFRLCFKFSTATSCLALSRSST